MFRLHGIGTYFHNPGDSYSLRSDGLRKSYASLTQHRLVCVMGHFRREKIDVQNCDC
jgi:hypothetical protein